MWNVNVRKQNDKFTHKYSLEIDYDFNIYFLIDILGKNKTE